MQRWRGVLEVPGSHLGEPGKLLPGRADRLERPPLHLELECGHDQEAGSVAIPLTIPRTNAANLSRAAPATASTSA